MQKQIFKTKNYKKFKFYEHNRDVKPSAELRDSMTRNGWLLERPALVEKDGEDLWVLDGQNRIILAKELGKEVYYEITDNANDSLMADLQTGRAWKPKDYLKHYYVKGNAGYAVVKSISDQYPRLSPTVIANLLAGMTYENASTALEGFKSGKIRVNNEKVAREILSYCFDLEQKFKVKWVYTRSFVLAMSRICASGNYDHKRFLAKLEYLAEKFVKRLSVDGYFELIKEIYNYKSRIENVESFDAPKKRK